MYTVSISTVDRQPQYVHDTIRSVLATLPDVVITLYVSGDHDEYLNEWKGNERIKIQVAEEDIKEEIAAGWPQKRCTINLWREIRAADPEKDLLAFEDDVELCDNFAKHLDECIAEAERLSPNGYVITFFYGYVFNSGKIAKFPIDDYYGTQALYISKKLLPALEGFYRGNDGNADFVMKDFLKANKIQLYGSVPHLVQHMGMISSGCGGIAKSSTYRKDY